MIFTPDDTLNYNTITKDIEIKVCLVKMIQIPAGTFVMGSSREEPKYSHYESPMSFVTLSGFYMSETVITQDMYQAVMGNNPSYFRKPIIRESGTPGRLPVESVTWYETLVFCNKLSIMEGLIPAYRIPLYGNSTDPNKWGIWDINGNISAPDKNNSMWNGVEIVPGSNGYRMPTEAQWEYACRAGIVTKYNTGNEATDKTGWYVNNSNNMTHEVGLKPPNAWGLYDMHGNVFEWCWDWFDFYPYVLNQTDPEGPPEKTGFFRAIRGGSYLSPITSLRSAFRTDHEMHLRFKDTGIRLVRPL